MSLRRFSRLLASLYDLPPSADVDVERFLCGAELVVATAGPDALDRGEVLLVWEDEGEVHVSLYLDPDALATVDGAPMLNSPAQDGFDAACLVLEGVSHLRYLAFRADHDGQVTQLELELQAEVDKYAAGLLGEATAEVLRERDAMRAQSRALRDRLYRRVRYLDAPDTVEGERYRTANRLAQRYTARLERDFVATGRLADLEAELRRFYRASGREKTKRAAT